MDEARKKKINAYLAELNELNKRYQLHTVPRVSISPKGIVPYDAIEDMLPEKPVKPKVEPKKEEATPPVDKEDKSTA